jgi:hypothetical protein
MKKQILVKTALFIFWTFLFSCFAAPVMYVNQVAYDARGAKIAVVQADAQLTAATVFTIIDSATSTVQFTDTLRGPFTAAEWASGKYFYRAVFSTFQKTGNYKVRAVINGTQATSESFRIDDNALAKLTLPWIVRYINKQRANTATEWQTDSTVLLSDGSKAVNVRGGWGDDAGNSSKYMSHLNYANFFSPQQIPMCAWELTDAYERIPDLAAAVGMKDSLQAEALWGADYLYRLLTSGGYFYMVVFDFLNCNTANRRVGGLLANSVMDNRWQCSFRAGGGMAIAALARISRWNKNGLYFTYQNYLDGAKRAFAHLLANNSSYLYDGKENIIDDYCALMAATELWIATDSSLYRDQARTRAQNLAARMSTAGYFIADNGTRPFWSACDAGMPVLALVRYCDKETDQSRRASALGTVKKALDYELAVTNRVSNPFVYPRQNFMYNNSIHEGFFIPQTNETGWWWQGENARLGSLATAAILGGRLVYPGNNGWGIKDSLAEFASQLVSWVLGCNPYSMCFMYGFGKNFPPVTSACFGHQSSKGGISNGITGKSGNGDGTGIDYNPPNGDSWRFTEQWIPHAVRMLAATAAMVQLPPTNVRQMPVMSTLKPHETVPGLRCGRTKITITFNGALLSTCHVALYSLAGQKIRQWSVEKGTTQAFLPFQRILHGIYCMKIEKQGTFLISLQ